MKSIFKVLFIIGIISVLFSNCKKENDEKDVAAIEDHFKESFFVVEGADFVADYIPEPSSSSSAPQITSVSGNNSVLAGGGNPISIESSSEISEILVAVVGEEGHYAIRASSVRESDGEYLVSLLISQDADEDFAIVVAAVNSTDMVSKYSKIDVAIIEAGTGQLQINCTWNKQNDVDLYLVEPSGEEISYFNSYSDNGGELDLDSNADCEIDGINSENITYSNDAIVDNGEYEVKVDFYSNCGITSSTNYIVTAYYGNRIISPSSGSNPYYGTFTASDVDKMGTVMKFNINARKSADISSDKHFAFKYQDGKQKEKNLSPNKNMK